MTLRSKLTAFAFLTFSGVCLTSVASHAASFNCRYAKLPAEVAICRDSVLHQLDQDMSDSFYYLRPQLSGSTLSRLNRTQRSFISRRNACGSNASCLEGAYNTRIEAICNIAQDNDIECYETN